MEALLKELESITAENGIMCTLRYVPQSQVWAGIIHYTQNDSSGAHFPTLEETLKDLIKQAKEKF